MRSFQVSETVYAGYKKAVRSTVAAYRFNRREDFREEGHAALFPDLMGRMHGR